MSVVTVIKIEDGPIMGHVHIARSIVDALLTQQASMTTVMITDPDRGR